MCTLAIYFQCSDIYPLVVAANRDEFFNRPAAPPGLLQAQPWVFGGRDLVAGGTWLGVTSHNLVGGLLNRRSHAPLDPNRRSRGHLCLDALQRSTAEEAATFAMIEPHDRYNPFNLLVADCENAFVVGNITGAMRCTRLSPGVHVLTNLDLNDMECPRLAKSHGMFVAAAPSLTKHQPVAILDQLRAILADHSTPLDPRAPLPSNNLCVHTEHFGTRSSTIVMWDRAESRFRLWHADGPPCITPFQSIDLPPQAGRLDNQEACR